MCMSENRTQKVSKPKEIAAGSVQQRRISAYFYRPPSDVMLCDILSLICSLKNQTAVAYFV